MRDEGVAGNFPGEFHTSCSVLSTVLLGWGDLPNAVKRANCHDLVTAALQFYKFGMAAALDAYMHTNLLAH